MTAGTRINNYMRFGQLTTPSNWEYAAERASKTACQLIAKQVINVTPTTEKINRNLSQLADGKRIRYLNVNAKLADSDGKLFDGMMNADKLHPAVPGYQVWADALKPIFTELLGPPGAQDYAPRPTGDPSAAR